MPNQPLAVKDILPKPTESAIQDPPVQVPASQPAGEMCPKVGDFVLVTCTTQTKRECILTYAGQIIGVEGNESFEVKFLRAKDDKKQFAFPIQVDVDIVSRGQIRGLPAPTINSRGLHVFGETLCVTK